MPNIDIRPVKNAQELEDMFYQRWLVLRSPLGMERGSERDDRENGACHIIAKGDRKIIGSGRLRELSPEFGSISYIAVLPEFQNQGIGTKMMERLIAQAKEKNFKTVRLMSRINAVKFYKNLGFVEKDNPFEYLTIPHIFMQLEF
ncbi:MAG: GNAT family N-acetyltransferase [Microcoleus sp. PH2017_10_PVI_O_A]|uniref:GNAT family N-acetyltransferase n=1 Tax=unclassified Microcoleus TaxID=2642155 RepID=UPI001DF207DF|nr:MULTISPECIES: GNAT family N-acetyltransferase [unclassified Microcoleus]TAE80522.1 MAG: N-acetyltransferase [Oscillatoriales cyanobacterium]MCC3405835.1 GNAT family N-acetyltransferase [Microcoleus sp. PH2017_10_PVI_O_A]MCC3459858.1 GNAT family N-acetyltransferase [Microcoleus sp. PH2017_11_PCY_U_A]MCC3478341.1 GNAT family N-acetyltransferase [Microcoleus sp. PH2017_12_PCY_D_A]MCC3528812.1 GNAT family N-acetyltransferase [Microcoleus sp. PH2017_21_RUC_O_A]